MKKIFFLLLFLPLLAQAQLELPFGVKVLNPEPLDAFYYNTSGAPYTSTSQVTSQIPSSLRYIGQTVNINNIEYWFGSGVLDANLVIKGSGNFWPLSGTGTLTGETTINGAFGLNLSGLTNFAVSSEVSSITTQYGFEVNDTDGGGIYFTAENAGGMGFVSISNSILIDSRHTNTNAIHLVSRGGGVRLNSSLSDLSATPVTQLHLTNTFATFTDNRATKAGIEYAADYSATFTSRSLVDKEYVDDAVAGASSSLTSTYVGYGSGTNTITGEDGFEYDETTNILYVPQVRHVGVSQSVYTDENGMASNGTIVITASDDLYLQGNIYLSSTPTSNNSATDILARNPSTGRLEYRSASTFTSSPAGSDTQVQYNNAGAFGAEAAFTYNASNNTLTVGTSGSQNVVVDDSGIDIQSTGGGQLTRYRYYGIEGDGTSSIGISNTGASNNVALSGNSGSSIILEIDSATSGDIMLTTGGAASGSYLILSGLPTSSAGLPSGAVWSNAGVLTVVP